MWTWYDLVVSELATSVPTQLNCLTFLFSKIILCCVLRVIILENNVWLDNKDPCSGF